MISKLVLAGGSGYLGSVLAAYFKDKAKEIVILTREGGKKIENGRAVEWNAESPGEWIRELEGADLLVNLCGKNVNCRYTEKNKAEIFRSRLVPTALLGKVIGELSDPPKVWINLASATIYRHAEDFAQDEETGERGTGFSVDVCVSWEDKFWKTKTPHTKKLILRTGMVLGKTDGVFPRLKNMVYTGFGGQQGSGKQMVSWIHELDFARIVEWAYHQGKNGAVYNCTAPEAITNHQLMKTIRTVSGISVGFSLPQWLLEMGALLVGTETELVLKKPLGVSQTFTGRGILLYLPGNSPCSEVPARLEA